MAKRTPKSVTITKQSGQLSAPGGMGVGGNFLLRQLPIWNNPNWLNANVWREFVRKQPVAVLCREAITNHLLSLDWNITARDSEQQDELKEDIKYYTRLLERGNAYYTDMDFTSHVEWIIKDLMDLPFGAASEIGREYNSPNGKVTWIRPLDGGTLSPTLDNEYPVAQHFPNYQPVVFPREFISRIYLSPRTEIQREGWGMPPPERIYLAMEMLNRGDYYYSQLLMNTPEAGILDLGDTDKETAVEWVNSARDVLFGINPLKIPVLYEHTSKVQWIPFGKLPSEIMYDSVTSRYITILTAGYGLTPSDIGMGGTSNGGETLSGTIRNERVSARSGKSLAKKKLQTYFNNILPETLQFEWIDFDDEKNVAMSRARMANANAASIWIGSQIFSPDEIRRQAIADGMFTITIPETLDRKSIEWPTNALRYIGKNTETPSNAPNTPENKGNNQIGNPKNPSQGGRGEVMPQQIISRSLAKLEVGISKSVYAANQLLGVLTNKAKLQGNFAEWELQFENAVTGKSMMDLSTEAVINDVYNNLADTILASNWFDTVSRDFLSEMVHAWNERNRENIIEVLRKRAESDFILGKSDTLDPDFSGVSILTKAVTDDLVLEFKKLFAEKVIPTIILISEKSIISDSLGIDPTDLTDNNNIRLAKSIAKKVIDLLPKLIGEAGVEIEKLLGDNDARL